MCIAERVSKRERERDSALEGMRAAFHSRERRSRVQQIARQ